MSGLVAVLAFIAILMWLATPAEYPVMHKRRGLELKARGGRLVHVRETESEHEI